MGVRGRTRDRGRRRTATLVLVLGLGLAATSAGAEAATAGCEAWPGEPSPLATTSSPDVWLARYAALRARSLAADARSAESQSPTRARAMWRHVLCLDPGNAEALRALERVRVVSVHRPAVEVTRRPPGDPEPTSAFGLDAPIRVAVAPEPARRVVPPEAAEDWSRTDAALGEAEQRLRKADFESALAAATRLRGEIGTRRAAPGAAARRARAEVVAATAEIALGREDSARRSFERALAADPSLTLDASTTPPKVRRVFDAVRAAGGQAR